MTTTYTPTPKFNISFYLALPCNMLDTRSDASPVTVTLPSETVFPTDLSDLISEIKRVVSFDQIVGKTESGTTVCTNEECAGYSSSDKIIYSLGVFYPPRTTYLYDFKPKIALVKYVPTMLTTPPPSMNTTGQPSTILSQNDYAIFRVTYNMRDFSEQSNFSKLYVSVVENQHYLGMLNEIRLIEHNLGTLQVIQKVNKVSMGSLPPIRRNMAQMSMTGTMPPHKLTARPGAKGAQMSARMMSGTPRPYLGSLKPIQMKVMRQQDGRSVEDTQSKNRQMMFQQR
jgi:hypothetical protein